MIAVIATGDLEEDTFVVAQRTVVPGQMRRRTIHARTDQRHDGRIVTAVTVRAAQPRIIDLRNQVALADTRFGDLEDAFHLGFHDPRCLAHVVEFLRTLHRALPVDQRSRVLEPHVRQAGLQCRECLGREVVVVHLDTDGAPGPATSHDLRTQHLHRVPLHRLDIMVLVTDEFVDTHVDGTLGTVHVLPAPEPDRIAVRSDNHSLMHIERPAIVAGEPGHVRGIAEDQQVDTGSRHRGARLLQTVGIFLAAETQCDIFWHWRTPDHNRGKTGSAWHRGQRLLSFHRQDMSMLRRPLRHPGRVRCS